MEKFKKMRKPPSLMANGSVLIRENHRIWSIPSSAYPYFVIKSNLSRRKFREENSCYGIVEIKHLVLSSTYCAFGCDYSCNYLHPFLPSQILFKPSTTKRSGEVT